MVKAEGNIIINAPVEKVFGLLIDTEKLPDWLTLMMEVHDIQGKGVGKKFKWTYKFIGIKFEGMSEIVEEIPNRKVLDSIILNYSGKKNIIDYSFPVGFSHQKNLINSELLEECIKPAIEKFYKKYIKLLPKKPEASMSKMDRLGREVMIRMFFPEGKSDSFYDIQPELLQEILNSWDNFMIKK